MPMAREHSESHCPKCAWRPQAEDRWECTPSCGTVWNTFWTRGVCPGCAVKWPVTQCLECMQFSPHEAWYHCPPDTKADASTENEAARA
jgi:hypothetical protein